jgi:hypothetical protein
MSGIKVLIDTKNYDNQPINGFGYILRRLNAQAYEIWLEGMETVLVLHPDEFKEIEENGNI